jgi:hypothetical protein
MKLSSFREVSIRYIELLERAHSPHTHPVSDFEMGGEEGLRQPLAMGF